MTVAAPSRRPKAAPTRFRLLAAAEAPEVDKEGGVIKGCSAIAVGPALGHGMLVDEKTCQQTVDLGNASPLGVKCRFTHPSLCADGLGSLVGHACNFRLDNSGDVTKARCDLKLLEASKESPRGDLYSYVMKLASESPDDFAMSIVFSGVSAWRLADGTELPIDDPSLLRQGDDEYGAYSYYDRPANATTEEPFARLTQLDASDLVDEPAANADGLFGRSFSTQPGAQAFADLDELLGRAGIDLTKAADFAARYFAARSRGAIRLSLSPKPPAGALRPASKGNTMKPEELKSLCAKHSEFAGLIVDMFADGKSESEILSAISAANTEKLGAQVIDLTTNLATATAAKTAAESERDAVKAKLAAADAQIEQFKKFGKITDPGAIPGSGSTTPNDEAGWRSEFEKNADLKEEFGGDVSCYVAFKKFEIAHPVKKKEG